MRMSQQTLTYNTAIMLYEYFITLENEVSLGWQRRVTATSIMFLLNRYVMLSMIISEIITMLPVTGLITSPVSQLLINNY